MYITITDQLSVYRSPNVPYSGYNLRGAISANHQIYLLEVIFAIVKFANHSMVCVARSNNAPAAY